MAENRWREHAAPGSSEIDSNINTFTVDAVPPSAAYVFSVKGGQKTDVFQAGINWDYSDWTDVAVNTPALPVVIPPGRASDRVLQSQRRGVLGADRQPAIWVGLRSEPPIRSAAGRTTGRKLSASTTRAQFPSSCFTSPMAERSSRRS